MEFPREESVPKDSQAEILGPGGIGTAIPMSCNMETQQLSVRRGIPEFSELILACRHRLLLTLFLGLAVSSTLVAIAWQMTDAPYEAMSLVRVRQHQDVVLTPLTSRADDADFVRSQEQLVLSPQVLAAALNNEQLAALSPQVPRHEAVDWLREMMRVEVQSGAELLSISSRHTSAEACQSLSAAVTLAYLDEVTNRTTADRRRRQVKLEQAAREADRKLDELWEVLNGIASKVGSENTQSLTIRDEIQLQAYRDYATQLRASQLRGNELRSLLTDEQLRVDGGESAVDDITEQMLQNHPDVVAIRNRIDATEAKIQQMREIVADDDSPRLKRLFDDRQFFAADLEKAMNDLRPKLREQSQERNRINSQGGLVQLQRQIELNESEKEFLHSRMAEIDTSIVRTNVHNGVQLEMSRHAVERQTRLADSLWRSLEEFKIEGQSQPRVSLIELAQLPSKANHTRQLKAALGSAGIGWVIVLLGIGFIEWRAYRVRDGDDVTAHSSRPVFGASSISGGVAQKGDSRFNSGANEAAARLMLLNKSSRSIPTLMVSSLSDSEPHHLVSLDLARVFCEFERRTLVIDCDTSRPYLSGQLSAGHLSGVIQVCRNQTDPRSCIVPSSEQGLHFMPLGLRKGATPRINPQALQVMLASLRTDYDAIVVNGPALMSSAASLLLASQVDQTVFAVFNGLSRWNQLAASEQVAVQAGIAVFGSVMRSPTGVAKLNLQFDQQGTRRAVEREETYEESLRETVTEIRQDLRQVGTHKPESPTRHESHKKLSS